MAYKYKGTTPAPEEPLYRCGTRIGYREHLRNDEPPCEDCTIAYNREKVQPAPPQPCGTGSAYSRHRRRGETPCDACKAAHSKIQSLNKKIARRRNK